MRDHYQEYGDKVFYRGYTKKDTRTPREIELERENEELKEEVKILKKAVAFLAGVNRKKDIKKGSEERYLLYVYDRCTKE